jgi:uncharacterized protein (DUF305 family)
MKRSSWSLIAAGLLAAVTLAPSRTAAQSGGEALSPAAQAKADGGVPHFGAADVHFMQGMIGHHAQAIVMANWAPSHGASDVMRVLCERIIVSQTDEIFSMQNWLRARKQTVPEADTKGEHAGMDMPGMSHELMPGMLTPEQMKQLDAARGPEFDKAFLKFMIQHHQGALTMVDQLFASQGAAQDDAIFKFASDVAADQAAEIDRMTKMLDAYSRGS